MIDEESIEHELDKIKQELKDVERRVEKIDEELRKG